MRRSFVSALVVLAAAFVCAGCSTTSANPADGDASPDDGSDGSEIPCSLANPVPLCPAASQQGCGYSMIDGCCVLMCPHPNCTLGAACSPTDVCPGGIVDCTSNCQCLNGTWQTPCPTDLPQTGSICAPFAAEEPIGAECGYPTSASACGAANCYCEDSGTWRCGPSCVSGGDASTDAGADVVVDAPTDVAADTNAE